MATTSMTPLPGFIERRSIRRPNLARTEYETGPAYHAILWRHQSPADCPATGQPLWYFVTVVNGPARPPYRNEYVMDCRHFVDLEAAREWVATLEIAEIAESA